MNDDNRKTDWTLILIFLILVIGALLSGAKITVGQHQVEFHNEK